MEDKLKRLRVNYYIPGTYIILLECQLVTMKLHDVVALQPRHNYDAEKLYCCLRFLHDSVLLERSVRSLFLVPSRNKKSHNLDTPELSIVGGGGGVDRCPSVTTVHSSLMTATRLKSEAARPRNKLKCRTRIIAYHYHSTNSTLLADDDDHGAPPLPLSIKKYVEIIILGVLGTYNPASPPIHPFIHHDQLCRKQNKQHFPLAISTGKQQQRRSRRRRRRKAVFNQHRRRERHDLLRYMLRTRKTNHNHLQRLILESQQRTSTCHQGHRGYKKTVKTQCPACTYLRPSPQARVHHRCPRPTSASSMILK